MSSARATPARDPLTRRCAIYTRKSSEEGLDQAFNSLHAQRDACEAYIASQAGEGWGLLAGAYDDGGYSGGSMARPALQRLLVEVRAGRLDVVVVYKVDRLTRSLADFARIVELFDQHGVSFVSVTQAFNTTTSMGRLTLNVLLSFAQFEREVTGERIRDKIAASKKKGLWMGGVLPLGYQVKDHRLAIVEEEAATVRAIFSRYLEVATLGELKQELAARNVRSKAWTTRAGRAKGGELFGTGALQHLLVNRHYTGAILHKALVYPDQHPAIVEPELFAAVQTKLAARIVRRHGTRRSGLPQALLVGRIFNGGSAALTPTFGKGRRGGCYRYYAAPPQAAPSQAAPPHAGSDPPPHRVAAEAMERFVAEALDRIGATAGVLCERVRRIDLRAASTELVIAKAMLDGELHPELARQAVAARLRPGERVVEEQDGEEQDGPGRVPGALRISLPVRAQFHGGRTWVQGAGAEALAARRRKAQAGLPKTMRAAHVAASAMGCSPLGGDPTPTRGPASTYEARLAELAFLAPEIQLDILAGRSREGVSALELLRADIPLDWSAQKRWWGAVADLRRETPVHDAAASGRGSRSIS